jgi:aspartate aminotransferase-like enzyme
MGLLNGFVYRIARLPWELEAIHALNYKTFVEEIPQHQPNKERKLIDRFHEQNTYIVCVDPEQHVLAGMVAFRNQRPFSLDAKLDDLDSYLPAGHSSCEIRLLAVEEKCRYTRICQELIAALVHHAIDRGQNLAVISGTVRQLKLYRYLGFVPFGPLVGRAGAQYQPMYLTLDAYRNLTTRSRAFSRIEPELDTDDTMLFNYLPGPVDFDQRVRRVYGNKPCSHRSEGFVQDFQRIRHILCALLHAEHVEILMGPGTLANDAIAGQLSLLGKKGLILISGEFGRRLVRNASGAKLSFYTLEIPEGQTFSREQLEAALRKHQDVGWVWGTHCETSTGVLHDLAMYKQVCADYGVKLCMDCISTIGIVPVDLSGIYLASGTSGKGLASIAGLALVFHDHMLDSAQGALPCILDIGYYQEHDGIPFTIQSNLVYALLTALMSHDWEKRFAEVRTWSTCIRKKLAEIEVPLLASEDCAMPAVVTMALPAMYSSEKVGDALKRNGVLVSYRSHYLLERNWIQICMMGTECKPVDTFIRLLKQALSSQEEGTLPS